MLFTVKAAINLKTTAEEIFPILADYDLYSRWIPDIVDSRVLVREGDIAVAEFSWPRFLPKKLVLEFVNTPPRSVSFSQIDQFRRRGLSGQWEIVDDRAGQGTILKYQMNFRTSVFNILTGKRLRSVMGAILAAVEQRVSEAVGEKVPDQEAGRKLILQVVRRPESVDVWFKGRQESFPIVAGPEKS